MSQPEHYPELARLLSGLLDGRLSDEELARLEQWLSRDPLARRLYMQYVDMEVEFSCLRPAPLASSSAAREPRSRRRRPIAFAAAAVLILGMGALGLWLGMKADPDGTGSVLAEVRGTVRIVSRAGRTQSGRAGETLRPNDTVQLHDENSSAQLTLPGGIQLTLSERASLTLEDLRQNSLVLREGKLEVSVKPQPEDRALIVTTHQVKVQVVGTQFTLRVAPEETELKVQEGRVRLTRLSNGKAADVNAGQGVLVRQDLDLMVQDLSESRLIWHAGFEDGLPPGWRLGDWVRQEGPNGSRGGVRAVPVSMPDPDDRRAWQIVSQKAEGGLFPMHPESHLRFTYKMARPGPVDLAVRIRERIGDGEQEQTWALEAERPLRDVLADRWYTASIPLSVFRPPSKGKEPPGFKGFVAVIVFSSGDEDRGLILNRVWVTQSGSGRVQSSPVP